MDLLSHASKYHALGWSLIPIKAGSKWPALQSWKRYQTKRATLATLRGWWSKSGNGMAVMLGEVSGGLYCRDFDQQAAYDAWRDEYLELAETLPTVATARGRHVYARCDDVPGLLAELQTRCLNLGDGEFRLSNCYCVLPPSRHPDGGKYRWINKPTDSIPIIDPHQAGFLKRWGHATENTEDNGGIQRNTEEFKDRAECVFLKPGTLEEQIQQAITATLPTSQGYRWRLVFEFARWLKAIPSLAGAQAKDLEPYVRMWHQQALPYIKTKPIGETMIDFSKGWKRIKFAKGEGALNVAFEAARRATPPQAATIYGIDELPLLACLCRELQRSSGENPFFLSCRTAGSLLGKDHSTASRWLYLLEEYAGLIKTVEKGTIKQRRATRFRYVQEL